jgi:Zn-dependent protease
MAESGKLPLFVFEDYQTLPLKPLYRLLGIPVLATPRAWTNALMMIPVALVLSLLLSRSASIFTHILQTVLWVLAFELTVFVHSIGHILSGKVAHAPMDRLVVTSTRQVTVYDGEQSGYAPTVHVLRALGGPVANIVVGILALIGALIFRSSPTFLVLALFNLAFGFGAALPIPSVDGEVIARYLFRS